MLMEMQSPEHLHTQLPLPTSNSKVSTNKVLESFVHGDLTHIDRALPERRRRDQERHAQTVQKLRGWAQSRQRGSARQFLEDLLCLFISGNGTDDLRPPSKQELTETVHHFFPPRFKLPVVVCDFGPGRAERRVVPLGNIEPEFTSKPEWATVRWISAPLGVGLLHSTIEDVFRQTGSQQLGEPFLKGGAPGWPYLGFETMDIRDASQLRDSRDLMRILQTERAKSDPVDGDVEEGGDGRYRMINDTLDSDIFVGDGNKSVRADLSWRAKHLGSMVGFWELARADLAWQLADGSYLNITSPSERLRHATSLDSVPQSISTRPYFAGATLARYPFRCFHRSDGYLLTLSPAVGINYLNANLSSYLHMTPEDLADDPCASASRQIFEEFAETGTDTWYRKNVEWFLVYLVTEVIITPHTLRQGYSVPSFMDAFDATVHELKRRRYDQWQRKSTVKLVRSYLACLDELNVLRDIFAKKLDFLSRLREDCQRISSLRGDEDKGFTEGAGGESPSTPSSDGSGRSGNGSSDSKDGASPLRRIAFAEQFIEQQSSHCRQLEADMRESLQSLFQLRSMEQNELAIMAETQNQVMIVFTGVTIIFLPLSFFTSYFGMNLRGLAETNRNERDFWKVCGSVSVGIVLLVSLYALRYRIRRAAESLRRRRRPPQVVRGVGETV